jgi:hypothetical protein
MSVRERIKSVLSGNNRCRKLLLLNPGLSSRSTVSIGSIQNFGFGGLAGYNGSLYAVNYNGTIMQINPSNGNITNTSISIANGEYYRGGIIDNGTYYVTTAINNVLYIVNLSSGTYTTKSAPHSFGGAIGYYNGYVYYGCRNSGQLFIYKLNLSSGVETLVYGSGYDGSANTNWYPGYFDASTGILYFDSYNSSSPTTAGTAEYNVMTGSFTSGSRYNGYTLFGAKYEGAVLPPASSPLTNGGTIGSNQSGCGTFDPANLTSITAPSGGTGSGAIQYRWRANGSIISGATSAAYDPGFITATTIYQREALRTGTSTWIASNQVTVTIGACNTDLTNGGTIGYNQSGCGTFDPANIVSVTAPSGGTGSGAIQYTWSANGSVIAGATSATYDPGPITTTTSYQRLAFRTGTSTWVASNTVTVTIGVCNTDLTNGGTIGSDQSGCGTFDPANLVSLSSASGGTGSGAIQYRWWANGSVISGATSATYDPGPITTTTIYQREANRTGTAAWVASNQVTVTIGVCNTDLTNGGTIGSDQSGCGTFDPANLTSVAAASGGTGSGAIVYRWKANGTIISGATAASYDPGAITATTAYVREAQRTGTATWVASNTVTVTVSGSCAIDFALNIEQTSSSLLSPGASATMEVYAENVSAMAGTYTITLSKPSAASGLTVSLGSSTQWTVTTTASQFTITGTGPVAGYGSVTIPVTITRSGGTKGSFTFAGTIAAPGDTNETNNNAAITVKKL